MTLTHFWLNTLHNLPDSAQRKASTSKHNGKLAITCRYLRQLPFVGLYCVSYLFHGISVAYQLSGTTNENQTMKLSNTESHLLHAIHEGREVAKGEDYETCRRLINAGLVKGIITSNLRDGDSYGALEITAIARENLTR